MLTQDKAFTRNEAASCLALFEAGGIAGSLIAGFVSDRVRLDACFAGLPFSPVRPRCFMDVEGQSACSMALVLQSALRG